MKYFLAIALLMTSYAASAGCKINLKVKNQNSSSESINISSSTTYKTSKVRNSGGTWRALVKGSWIGRDLRLSPGQEGGGVYNATYGCNKKRRYRIAYSCGGDTVMYKYYPSGTTWTKNTNIRVNLYCP